MRNSLSSQELRWKIIYSGTRRDAIKQIEVLLSIIGNDETMMIDMADDRLKSYLIESSYAILVNMDFTEVFK